MLYDLRVTPVQLKRAGRWVQDGENMADVELVADDSMLLAQQGDERMAWDTDGSKGSAEYLSKAPLDPRRPDVVALTASNGVTVKLELHEGDDGPYVTLTSPNGWLDGEMPGEYWLLDKNPRS